MNFDIFAPDYGTLPSDYFAKSLITNPIELFWSDDLLALLRLCGQKEESIGERASDFDKFQALCRAFSLLEGHPTRAWILSVLEEHFSLKEIPNEKNATELWQILSQALLERPIAAQDLVGGAWLCDATTVPAHLPTHITPVLHANRLLQTNAKNTLAWSAEIASTVAHFAENGCKNILLHVTKDFDFATPSLYGVDRALSLAKKDRTALDLLTSQLVRELCTVAQKHDLLLVLVCDENASAVATLLQYCEESVGLPRITWSAQRVREAQALFAFTAQPHQNKIHAALLYENVMTQAELSNALESLQVRYPVGKLCFITARDLRQMPSAQAHISAMLQKTKTKI